MTTADLRSPDLYISRELSWLEFNERVLQQGMSEDVPLMERLKFLSIVCSNLDEFFMIRVAGLKQQVAAGVEKRDISGLTAAQQLERISERTHRMVAQHADAVREVLRRLAAEGLRLLDIPGLSVEQQRFVDAHFVADVQPLLTPLAVDELEPFPVLPGLGLNLALALRARDGTDAETHIAIVPVPRILPRFITLPAASGLHLVRLEQVIGRHAGRLFPQYEVEALAEFRLTRDADVAVQDDDADDLLQAIEDAVRARRRRSVVRLEVSAAPDPRLRKWLTEWTNVSEADVYEVDGLLDGAALMDVATRRGFDNLKDKDWPPQTPADLLGSEDVWDTLQNRDVLLFHPYESFEPVVSLLQTAAADPNVLAIKQTLYRTSGDSPVVAALADAAEQGKQVTVLVELKARFDEARNVNWARRLEDAGCHVIYGIAGLKTHAKALLIIRREAHGIRRYLHLSTGNYNDRTAKLYSDIGLMTTDRDFALDAAAFFNLLTGYSQQVGWSRFAISPTGIRRRIVEMIEREIDAATLDQPGLIMAKVNSLHDRGICEALYTASRAGVQVRLNIRGICCLRPGMAGASENIEVVSIVDRYLEHARVLYFRNGGHEEVYLSSADWMGRNLDRRLEIMFPVVQPKLRARMIRILETFFADNVKAWRLRADGEYERVVSDGPDVRAQEVIYRMTVEAAQSGTDTFERFRPLMSPQVRRDR